MSRGLSRQKGLTLISFMLMFAALGFIVLIFLKLLPIYMEHYKVQATLNNLKIESGLTDMTPGQITALLQKRWDVNSIDRIQAKESAVIEKHPGYVKVQVAYEVEEHLVANVSALVKFDDTVEIGEQN